MIKKYYTGIGSRKAPEWALEVARKIGIELGMRGYILRSGAAEGMDTAFETGCNAVKGQKDIYLPWQKFNNHPSQYYTQDDLAKATAMKLHPNWEGLSQGARKLHSRNVYQIVGHEWEHPSRFVICYSNQGKGGTMQAVRLANQMGIKVIDYCDMGYDGSLWELHSKGSIAEVVQSILNQVLIYRHKLKPKVKEPFRPKRFIHGFEGPYDYLSNFYRCEYQLNGKSYFHVEGGFQSEKTDPPSERIRVAMGPKEAKRLGRMVTLRPDWEEIKEEIMYKHVRAKFEQNENLRQQLVNTRNAILCEDNNWHDNEWGDCTCEKCYTIEGQNKLGEILMMVREDLKGKAFYCKLFNNYRYDGKCNDMACEFCDDYYDEKRKQWWYHPESESIVYDVFTEKDIALGLENIDDKISTRVVHVKSEEYDVYIGRGSDFGNPFRIGIDGDRKEVLAKFSEYLNNNTELQKKAMKLRGLRLGCHCSPNDCHGDIIAEFIENKHLKRRSVND